MASRRLRATHSALRDRTPSTVRVAPAYNESDSDELRAAHGVRAVCVRGDMTSEVSREAAVASIFSEVDRLGG